MNSIENLIKTYPRDRRFPNTNQVNHCWNRYNEWVMCLKGTNGDADACKGVRQMSLSVCPEEWTNKWDDERAEGSFGGVQYNDNE